ncbi:MAG TPA: hypothetical protein VIM99_16930 [Blastocatellia bacterium]
MRVDPGFHALNFIEAFVPKFTAVKIFLSAARLLAANLFLPGRGEDQIDVIVKFARLEGFPFIPVEPDAAAGEKTNSSILQTGHLMNQSIQTVAGRRKHA